MRMRSKRFILLAVGLVALNVFFWLAPAGLAVREALINQLFGPRLIRAEVVVRGTGNTTQDYLIDRGVTTVVGPDSLVLREQDGKLQTIGLAATTQVTGPARFASVALLRKNLRLLVFREGNGPASLIQVEGRVAPRAAVP